MTRRAVLSVLFSLSAAAHPGIGVAGAELPPQYRGAAPPEWAETVLDLQLCRRADSLVAGGAGGEQLTAVLVDPSPAVRSWYLLRLRKGEGAVAQYHLQSADPTGSRVTLDRAHPTGVVITTNQGTRHPCDLWSGSPTPLATAAAQSSPYVPLCDDLLYLRNPTAGHKTTKEWATDFLRDYVPAGERITSFVRGFYKDTFAATSEVMDPDEGARPSGGRPALAAPLPPLVDPRHAGRLLQAPDLGIEADGPTPGTFEVGRWYRATGAAAGVFVSVIQPQLLAAEVVAAARDLANPLDATEEAALVYLVAFDLTRFDLGFSVGTEHPRVDWSDRVRPEVRDAAQPGPDGIATLAPLVRTGMLPPALGHRAVATFTGGFKRYHGAFRWGDLAMVNHGSHYGFVEEGVVLSVPRPGLATAVVYVDGRVDLGTWREADAADLCRIRSARQNGVPIVERDPATGQIRPGALVRRTGPGNWSGAVDGRYRTLRAGIGLQDTGGTPFLIYAYFSAATASAMARVFMAYQCRYAMLTDMNALEHTYLALYAPSQDGLRVQHLVQGMSVLDKVTQGQVVPRFLGYADNRDFFYLLRKETP